MYMDFNVSSFWIEIAILRVKFDILGVNRGQMLKLNTLIPKRLILAQFRAF